MNSRVACLLLLGLGLVVAPAARSAAPAVLPALEKASWIWRGSNDPVFQARIVFSLEAAPAAATILVTADNGYELYVNGTFVGADVGAAGDVWSSVERYDAASRLTRGRNVIGIRATDLGGVRGLIDPGARRLRASQPITRTRSLSKARAGRRRACWAPWGLRRGERSPFPRKPPRNERPSCKASPC